MAYDLCRWGAIDVNGVVLLTSGGLFSAVAACRAAVEGRAHLLFADWGQCGAAARRDAVIALAKHLGCELTCIDMPHVRRIDDVGDAAARRTNASPLRLGGANLAIIAAGLSLADAIGATEIHVGVCEQVGEKKASPTPHHRREYIYLANHLFEELTPSARPVTLKSPLIDLSAAEIVKLGHRLKTPFENTHSCKMADAPCDECLGCRTRQQAFAGAAIVDPLTNSAHT